MEEDIKILQNLASRTRPIAEDLETAVCSIDEQVAIRKLIARYKELEEENKKYVDILHDLKASWGNRKKYKDNGNHIPRID